jgi:exosortase
MSTAAVPTQAALSGVTGLMRRNREVVGVIAVLVLLYWRTLVDLVVSWWDNPDYSHGIIIPFVIGYLLHSKWDKLSALEVRPSWLGLLVVVGSQVVNLVGFLGAEFFLQRISLVMFVIGAILFLWGWKHLWEAAVPIFLFVLAIPLPTLIFNTVALPLQLLASSFAERFLGLLHIPVFREGNVLMLANQTLNVAEACSGIRSLMSLITLAVIFAYFLPVKMWLRLAFVATSVPIALIANAFRVGGTGVLSHYYGEKAAEGFFHTFSGWLVFVFAFAFMMMEVGIVMRIAGKSDRKKGAQA